MTEQNQDDAGQSSKDNIKQIKNEVHKEHGTSKLRMNRVPDETVEKFKDLASSKMANDYGLTLAYLLEIHELTDRFSTRQQEMMQKITELEAYVQEIEAEKHENKDNDSKVDTIR